MGLQNISLQSEPGPLTIPIPFEEEKQYILQEEKLWLAYMDNHCQQDPQKNIGKKEIRHWAKASLETIDLLSRTSSTTQDIQKVIHLATEKLAITMKPFVDDCNKFSEAKQKCTQQAQGTLNKLSGTCTPALKKIEITKKVAENPSASYQTFIQNKPSGTSDMKQKQEIEKKFESCLKDQPLVKNDLWLQEKRILPDAAKIFAHGNETEVDPQKIIAFVHSQGPVIPHQFKPALSMTLSHIVNACKQEQEEERLVDCLKNKPNLSSVGWNDEKMLTTVVKEFRNEYVDAKKIDSILKNRDLTIPKEWRSDLSREIDISLNVCINERRLEQLKQKVQSLPME
jgi:hypothetical protein